MNAARYVLEIGAGPNQRGVNDYTPLHVAVTERKAAAVVVLLGAGADPMLRTRIDDRETRRELAETVGLTEVAAWPAARESAFGG